MSEILVQVRHCVGVDGRRYCARGLRAFCRTNELDLMQLTHEGIPIERIEATGDAMAIFACKRARDEAMKGV